MTANHKTPISSCLLMPFYGPSAAQMRLPYTWTWTETTEQAAQVVGKDYIRQQTMQEC